MSASQLKQNELVDIIKWRRRVEAKTTDYTITVKDHYKIFTNRGAVGAVVLTLPDATLCDGLQVSCYLVEAQSFGFLAAPTDQLVTLGDKAADTAKFSTASKMIGAGMLAISDGVGWLLFPHTWNDGTNINQVTITT